MQGDRQQAGTHHKPRTRRGKSGPGTNFVTGYRHRVLVSAVAPTPDAPASGPHSAVDACVHLLAQPRAILG